MQVLGKMKTYSSGLVIAVAAVLLPLAVSAQTVSLAPASTTIGQNQQFTVDVNVSGASNLFGVGFDLLFDPALLQFVSATDGGFLTQGGAPISFLTTVNPPGDLVFSQVRMGSAWGGVSGNGTIAHLIFRSLAQDGQSNLSFSGNSLCVLSGSSCSYVTGTWQGGSVTISTPDTIAPSVPGSLTAAVVSASQINLNWNASTDNKAVTGYRVYRNGGLLATVTSTTYSDTFLTPITTYSYQVSAIDAAGNESARSTAASATTAALPDTTAPSTPTGLVASVVSTSQINLAWNASTDPVVSGAVTSGLAGYRVYRNNVLVATITATSYQNTGLAAVTTYSFKIVAVDNAGNASADSSLIYATTQSSADITAPSTPSGLAASVVSTSQINLSWNASTDPVVAGALTSGVASYRVYRDNILLTTVTSTSYQNTGLAAGTTYSYQVSAVDVAGNESGRSTSVNATTLTPPDTIPPSTPANLRVVSVTTDRINLAWNASTDNVGVTGYLVYRDNVYIMTVASTSYYNAGLAPGESHSYRVSAIDAAFNESTWSAAVTAATQTPQPSADVTAPSLPTGLYVVSATTDRINLAWNASTDPTVSGAITSGLAGYRIYRNNVYMMTVTSPAYYNAGLPSGTTYSYQVSAVDVAGNESGRSASVSATTQTQAPVADTLPPSVPGNLRASLVGPTSVSLNWNASTDPTSATSPASGLANYRVYRNNLLVASPSTSAYLDQGLASSSSYTYYVVAVDKAGNVSARSSSVQVSTGGSDRVKPNIPGYLRKKTATSYTIEIAWNAATDPSYAMAPASGVVGYKIYRNSVNTDMTAGLSYLDQGLTPETRYSYQVRSVDAAGNESGLSSVLVAATDLSPDTTPPAAPTNLRANYNLFYYPRDVRLYWYGSRDNRPGVIKYNIYRNGEWLASTTAISYFNKLSDYGVYNYQVKAVDKAGNESTGSNVVSVSYAPDTTPPAAPTNLRANYNLFYYPQDVRLYWYGSRDERPGVIKYNIYRNGDWLASTTAASYFNKLSDYGAYNYQVKAVDKAGNESGPSNTVLINYAPDTTAPSSPTNPRYYQNYRDKSQIRLYWYGSRDERPGAVKYIVYRNGEKISTVNYTSFGETLATQGYYQYQVAAIDVAGNESNKSTAVSVVW